MSDEIDWYVDADPLLQVHIQRDRELVYVPFSSIQDPSFHHHHYVSTSHPNVKMAIVNCFSFRNSFQFRLLLCGLSKDQKRIGIGD